jgi:hypothetical protein
MEEATAACSIESAMIRRERDFHDWAYFYAFSIAILNDNGSLCRFARSENRALAGSNNCMERINAIHAEVRNGKRGTCKLIELEFPLTGSKCEALEFLL